jgi:hypothetical protein
MDLSLEERPVARAAKPPADADNARKHEVAEAPFGVDLASERDVLECLLTDVAPARGADGPYRAVVVDLETNLGALGREVESGDDDVVRLGSSGHPPVRQHGGWREHDALDGSPRRRRPGGVGVVGVKQGRAPKQAALGAAGCVGVAVGHA